MSENQLSDELDTAVSKTVEYMTARFKVSKALVEEPNIIKKCFKGRNDIYDDVMKIALQRLTEKNGYRVIEVEARARNKTIIRKYFRVHNYVSDDNLKLTQQERDYEIHLVNVLYNILLSNGRCHENVIWDSLIRIQILKYEGRFEILRKRILKTYRDDMYLRTCGNSRMGIYLTWGLRAYKEFDCDLHKLRAYSGKILAMKPEASA